jgi:hypothetical protein
MTNAEAAGWHSNPYDFLTDGARHMRAFCRPWPIALVSAWGGLTKRCTGIALCPAITGGHVAFSTAIAGQEGSGTMQCPCQLIATICHGC